MLDELVDIGDWVGGGVVLRNIEGGFGMDCFVMFWKWWELG